MFILSRRTSCRVAGFAVLLIVACGCGQKAGPPSVGDKKGAGGVPADHSLTPDAYIQAGVPALDRPWSGEDMAKAARVLTALSGKDPGNLPRFRSERSGAVFARLTSTENLEAFRNRKVPIETRFPQAIGYGEPLNAILKLYLSAFLKNAIGDSEIVELLGAQLRIMVMAMELVDEFIPTLDKNDPKFKVRMQGLEKMKQGLAMMAAGGLLTLTEVDSYRSGERARLVGYMKETFPAIVPRLLPDARAETLARLEALEKDPKLQDLQPGLTELRTAVMKSVGKAKAP
jgi:hypothetical protein